MFFFIEVVEDVSDCGALIDIARRCLWFGTSSISGDEACEPNAFNFDVVFW